jgi:hypothetical protein
MRHGVFIVVSHLLAPILVVTDYENDPMVQENTLVLMHVDVGTVTDVVALSFQPPNHRIFPVEELACTIVLLEGPIEGHVDRTVRIGFLGRNADVLVERLPPHVLYASAVLTARTTTNWLGRVSRTTKGIYAS